MKNLFIYFVMLLSVLCISFSACSKGEDVESETGEIEKITDQIAENALNAVLTVTAAEVGWIYLREDDTGDLVLASHRGLSPEYLNDAKRIKQGENLDGQVARSEAPVVMTAGSREFGAKISGREDAEAVVVVPLRSRLGFRGTLGIVTTDKRYAEAQELNFLTSLGDEIGIAIGHARLHQKERASAQQLRLSEERYRGLFENASEAIFVCSSAGRIISANRACEQLTSYSQEELSRVIIYDLFSGTSRETVKHLFTAKLEEATTEDAKDLHLITKDGKDAFVELKVSPLLRGDEIVGLQIIVRDVTEERQLRQNMQYYISRITMAQEDERLRISRELHDDTAQVLVSLARGLDLLISGKSKMPKSVTENLEKLYELTESALEGVRRFSQDLRPSVLDDLGLVPALEWLIADIGEQYGMATKVSITGDKRRLTSEKELTIFRIAQESLSNVKKHSLASTVEMTVDFSDDALTLVISDDGEGFHMPGRTSDLVLSGKLGVLGMRERARLVGGTLIVQSEIGTGTTVTLRVPI